MNMREQFEAWSASHEYLGCIGLHRGSDGDYSDMDLQHAWETWQAARATPCPGHGRSECVSCCWPKGEALGVELGRQLVEQVLSVMPENYAGHSFGVTAPDGSTLGDVIITVIKPDGKGPHDLRVEAESRVTELENLLTLARRHVPVTDPLRGLINANLMQHMVEQDPWADFKDAAPAAYTAVDMGTAAADGYRDGAGRVAELEAFLTKLKHEDVEFYGSAIELGNSGPDGVELHEELLRLMP